MTKLKMVNIVVTADLTQNVDLQSAGVLGLAEYSEKKYGGRVAYFKTKQMGGKVSLFETGKMISIGNVSLEDALRDLNKVRTTLEHRGLIKRVTLKPIVRNLVFVVDFGEEVDLEMVARKRGIIYEPEQFPGAIIKLEKPYRASVLLFASGKAVVAGLTNPQQISGINSTVLKLIEDKNDI